MAPQYTIDVIVDLQNDFITGALGTAEAQAIVERAAETAARAAAEGHPLFFTLDTHGPDYLATREGGDLPVPHCLRGTEGHALAPAIEAVAKAEDPACPAKVLVEKDTFGAKALPGKIRDLLAAQGAGDDAIEKFRIYGVCTDICVISNAMILKAYLPEVPVIVEADCCAGVTPESHKNALEAMKVCQIKIEHGII